MCSFRKTLFRPWESLSRIVVLGGGGECSASGLVLYRVNVRTLYISPLEAPTLRHCRAQSKPSRAGLCVPGHSADVLDCLAVSCRVASGYARVSSGERAHDATAELQGWLRRLSRGRISSPSTPPHRLPPPRRVTSYAARLVRLRLLDLTAACAQLPLYITGRFRSRPYGT